MCGGMDQGITMKLERRGENREDDKGRGGDEDEVERECGRGRDNKSQERNPPLLLSTRQLHTQREYQNR